MAEEPSLSYLPIAGGRIIGFIPFPRVLVLCEMQWASSRIWTRIAVSISNDDNHYTTGTKKVVYIPSCCLFVGSGLVWTITIRPRAHYLCTISDKNVSACKRVKEVKANIPDIWKELTCLLVSTSVFIKKKMSPQKWHKNSSSINV